MDQDTAQKQMSCPRVSNADRQWVKKRLDAVSHPFDSKGTENIETMMNSVHTELTV